MPNLNFHTLDVFTGKMHLVIRRESGKLGAVRVGGSAVRVNSGRLQLAA